MYQYQCACCNKTLFQSDKECQHCGSHHIRSPFSGWLFCILACLAVVVTLKLVHVYVQNHQDDVPRQQSIFDVLSQDEHKGT